MGKSGVNGYSGEILDSIFEHQLIVRGNTTPVTVIMKENGVGSPIAGFVLLLSFDRTLACDDLQVPELEVEIPVVDAPNGVWSGFFTDDESFSLPPGKVYVSLKYIDDLGMTFIIDMVKYKVVNCVNPRRV